MNRRKETSISLMKHFMIDLSFLLPQYYLNILNMINTHFFIYKPYFNDGDECEYELRGIYYNDTARREDSYDSEPDYYYSKYDRNKRTLSV